MASEQEVSAEGGGRWRWALVFVVPWLIFFGWPGMRDGYIHSRGVATTAKIIEVRDTGERPNDDPVLAFRVEFQPPGGAWVTAEAEAVISPLRMAGMRSGAEIHIKYLTGAPTWVLIEE